MSIIANDHLAPMEIVESAADCEAFRAMMARLHRNAEWLEQHASEVYRQHRGKCICVAGQELFVAETPEQAIALASAKHPQDDGPLLRYIPQENVPRIYANRRPLA